jgi:hypothetical protein
MKKKVWIFIPVLLVILYSCTFHKDRLKVDISDIKISPVKINRYDQALFRIPLSDLENHLKSIQAEYSFFLGTDLSDPAKLAEMKDYLMNPRNVDFNKAVQQKFSNLSPDENELTNALRYCKYYFPGTPIPRVYSYISGGDYDYPVRLADSVMIIALDCYLGSDFKPYLSDGIPLYKTQRMIPSQIVPDCMRSVIENLVPPDMQSMTFLDQVVEAGKKFYLLDAFLPDVSGELKMKYTKEQYSWAIENESHIWSAIVENQVLYTSDGQTLRTFLADGPFTTAFGKESPPRLGEWIGWRIVKAFMDNNPDVTLKQLVAEKDAQSILARSGYKPDKN